MVIKLVIGSLIVGATIIVMTLFMIFAMRFLEKIRNWFTPRHTFKSAIALVGAALWLLAALSIAVWIWAGAFIVLGQFEELEPALYFSVITFTTLGYGDITLSVPWRILSGLCAANGLLLFGLSTAFMVEFFKRLQISEN